MTDDGSYDTSLAEAFTQAIESAYDAGESRHSLETEATEAWTNIADSLEYLVDMNRAQIDSATSIHEKLNQMDEETVDEDYIISEVGDMLDDRLDSGTGYRTGDSGFSTWSNYNFGTQAVSGGFSARSNYNFGTQITGFDDVEAIEGEINEGILDNSNTTANSSQMETPPTIFNPQIKFSPTINVTAGEQDFNFEEAS